MQMRLDLKLILLGLALANGVFSLELKEKVGFVYREMHHNLTLTLSLAHMCSLVQA